MTRMAIALTTLLLTGCGLLSGEPDEAEQVAERLRQPPDVLADARLRGSGGTNQDGRSDEQAGSASEAALGSVDGQPVLDLGLPYNAAWAVVGRAVDRVGFELLSSDRDAGTHQIRYDGSVASEVETAEGNGLLSSLAFWRDRPDEALQAPLDRSSPFSPNSSSPEHHALIRQSFRGGASGGCPSARACTGRRVRTPLAVRPGDLLH